MVKHKFETQIHFFNPLVPILTFAFYLNPTKKKWSFPKREQEILSHANIFFERLLLKNNILHNHGSQLKIYKCKWIWISFVQTVMFGFVVVSKVIEFPMK